MLRVYVRILCMKTCLYIHVYDCTCTCTCSLVAHLQCAVLCICVCAQIIDEEILCVHGGLSPDVKTLDQVLTFNIMHVRYMVNVNVQKFAYFKSDKYICTCMYIL